MPQKKKGQETEEREAGEGDNLKGISQMFRTKKGTRRGKRKRGGDKSRKRREKKKGKTTKEESRRKEQQNEDNNMEHA